MKLWFLKLNLFHRLMLYFTIIIIFSILFVTVIIYVKSSKAIENQVSVYLKQIVNNVNYQMDNYIRNYELETLPLVTDRNVINFVDEKLSSSYERYRNFVEIKEKMSTIMRERPEIEQIYIMEENGEYILANLSPLEIKAFYQELDRRTPDSGRLILYPRLNNGNLVITMVRKIRGTGSFEPKGILAVDINASKFADSWAEIGVEDNSFFMIVDEEGRIVYHQDHELVGNRIHPSLENKVVSKSENQFFENWNDGETFFYYSSSDYTGWKVIYAVPTSTLFQSIDGVRTTVLVSAALALLIALFFAQHFIRKIIRPIRVIERTMKNVEKGKWELAPEPKENDEITSLVKNYNKMVKRLSYLVDQVYKVELENNKGKIMLQQRELEKRKVEFQALQSQINPHFLYNTLGTINSYAIIKEIDEISEMTAALANMFRYSVQNLEVVTLKEELSHVKDFLLIQQHRWQKAIPLEIKVEEKLLDAHIVKLSLQPLIENAMEHGFHTITDTSQIIIKAELNEEKLFVSVHDNGVGIEKSKLWELRERLEKEDLQLKPDEGIGLLNVAKRIKLLFGEDFGVEVFSEPNTGTTVKMSLPYSAEKIQNDLSESFEEEAM